MNTTKKEAAKKLVEGIKLGVKAHLSCADFKVYAYTRKLVGWTAIGEIKFANKISIVSKQIANHSAKTFNTFLDMGQKYDKKYAKAKAVTDEIKDWTKEANQFVAKTRKQEQPQMA